MRTWTRFRWKMSEATFVLLQRNISVFIGARSAKWGHEIFSAGGSLVYLATPIRHLDEPVVSHFVLFPGSRLIYVITSDFRIRFEENLPRCDGFFPATLTCHNELTRVRAYLCLRSMLFGSLFKLNVDVCFCGKSSNRWCNEMYFFFALVFFLRETILRTLGITF